MIAQILGLSINQKVLKKSGSSSSPVIKSLEKTALNYLAIGKMASDLTLIKFNFSRWLAIEGVKVTGKTDAHFLKEDERAKKFNVLREKFVNSKVSKKSKDGTESNKGGMKTLLLRYVTRKFTRGIERNITAAVLKKLRKVTVLRKLLRIRRIILKSISTFLKKFNFKKMFIDWFKANKKIIIDKIIDFVKRKFAKVAIKLAPKLLLAAIPAAATGPFAPLTLIGVTLALLLFDGFIAGYEEYKKGGSGFDIFRAFVVGTWESFTLGLIDKDILENFFDWHVDLIKKLRDGIKQFTNFLVEKVTIFSDFVIEKFKKIFTADSSPEKYKSAVDEYNKKRIEEEMNERKKYEEYFNGMYERLQKKRNYIKDLQTEISLLEDERDNEGKAINVSSGASGFGLNDRIAETKTELSRAEQDQVAYEQEKQAQYTGTDPIVRKRLGLQEQSLEEKTKERKKEESAAASKQLEGLAQEKQEKGYERGVELGRTAALGKGTGGVTIPAPAAKSSSPSKTSGEFENIKQMVIANEGWKTKPYKDTRGYWTVGVGHLINPKSPKTLPKEWDRELTNEEVRQLFEKDFDAHLKQAQKTPGWDKANEAGKAGLVDLTYNMGGWWYTKFVKAAGLLKEGNFKDAALELKNSDWYKQVGGRAPVTISLISSGSVNDKGGSAALASVMSSTKVASAGKFLGEESTQVAQAQRDQMKPKDVDVINVAKTNNQKIQNQEVASKKPTNDVAAVLVERTSA
jgi:GH24 family phage-related lysozyme (muramidase)